MFRVVCHSLLDLILDTYGCHTWQDGSAGDTVPGAGQHLQHSHYKHSKGWRTHCHRGLDVGLYPLCIRSTDRVRGCLFLQSNKYLFSCMQVCSNTLQEAALCFKPTQSQHGAAMQGKCDALLRNFSLWWLLPRMEHSMKFKRKIHQTGPFLSRNSKNSSGGKSQ